MSAFPLFDPVGAPATVTCNGDDSAATLAAAPTGANAILIGSKTNNAMITIEGTTPTVTVGIQLVADAEPLLLPLTSRNSVVKHINETPTSDAVLQYQYCRVRRSGRW